MSVEHCRSCPAEVRWVLNPFGKWQILDLNPSPQGNIRIENRQAIVLGRGQAEEARAAGEQLYIDHHATCPKAADWKKRKRA